MKWIERSANACSLWLYRLAYGAVLPVLTLLLIADIAYRTLATSTLHWASEMSGFLLLSLFFLALPHLAAQRSLLRIDLLLLAPIESHPTMGRVLAALPPLTILLFSLLMITQSTLGLRDMLQYGDQAFSLPMPLWPFCALMLVAGALLFLQSLFNLVHAVRGETL